MEHDPAASGTRPMGVMRYLTTPGNTIDPRIEALAAMTTDPDASNMLPRGMMSLCQPRKPDPVVEAWLAGSPFMAEGLDAAEWVVKSFRPVKPTAQWIAALLTSLTALAPEIQRGPTIGRKRRARRARGRARAAR